MSVFFLKFPGDNDMQFSVGTSDLEKPDQCSGSQLLRYIRITWGNFKKKKGKTNKHLLRWIESGVQEAAF